MPYAELTDCRCYYEQIGSGDPLLLVPGLGAMCNSWAYVANDLAESFTLIMPELRGVGRSVARKPPANLTHLSADLVELLDVLQVDRTHVLGISLGGIVAQQFVIDHPSRVDRLVLMSCAHRFGPYLREMAMMLAHALRYFPREIYQRMIEVLGTAPGYLDGHPGEIDQKVSQALGGGASRTSIARQLRCLGFNDVGGQHYHIAARTLVLAGEFDVIIPSCYGRLMAQAIPDSEFEVLPNCGHNPLTEIPEVVLPRIIRFLKAAENIAPSGEKGGLSQRRIEESVR